MSEEVRDCGHRQEQLWYESDGFDAEDAIVAVGTIEVEDGVVNGEIVSVVDTSEVIRVAVFDKWVAIAIVTSAFCTTKRAEHIKALTKCTWQYSTP